MNVLTLASVIPDVPTVPAGTDTMVIVGTLSLAALVIALGVAWVLFTDALKRRPADVALWLAALRMGLGPKSIALLRTIVRSHPGSQLSHPVGFLLCPKALVLASASYLSEAPTPARAAAVAALMRRVGVEAAPQEKVSTHRATRRAA
jgi:hypothetical protein